MTRRSENEAIYATEVRSALGRPLEDHERDLMRELYDDDVSAADCALHIENANETAWITREADPECIAGMSRQERESIRGAGRSHLLLEK